MDEQRQAAYLQLIKKLIESPSEEKPQVLVDNFQLVDPGLLETIVSVAQEFDDIGNQNASDFLTNVTLELGELMGRDQQPIAIRKQTADILLKCGIWQYEKTRKFLKAVECWQKCLNIYQAIQDPIGEANSLGNLGNAYFSLGEYEQVIGFEEKCLAISREIQYRQGESGSLGILGNAYYFLEEYEKAIDFYKQRLAISREINDLIGEANSLGNLGEVYLSLGEYNRAISFQEESLAMSRKIGYTQGEANSVIALGKIYYFLEEHEKAIDFLERSLTISRKIICLQDLIFVHTCCDAPR
ncbi:MAG: tetratricopeptide repeat protein [Okeania sp. SIO2D1]|nr:tetratricopeptide repeat protein [Okeania sp. SIO2D1]